MALNRQMGAHGAAPGAGRRERPDPLQRRRAGHGRLRHGARRGARPRVEAGKRLHVYVDETRPFLQGARLTAWELHAEGIPLTLIADNMAGHFMARGQVDLVVVGADRIAANGDVANKIGTYTLAVLAHENGIPFYVAAPTSTIDLSPADAAPSIPIEERAPDEVTHFARPARRPGGRRRANPAFDVTPAPLRDRDHHRARRATRALRPPLAAAVRAPRPSSRRPSRAERVTTRAAARAAHRRSRRG